MDHAIVMVLQIAQESRQHGRGLRLRIVQQDDPLAGGGSLLATLSIRSLTKQQRGTPDVRAIKATLRVSAAGMDDLA